jgi:hypothetical protein
MISIVAAPRFESSGITVYLYDTVDHAEADFRRVVALHDDTAVYEEEPEGYFAIDTEEYCFCISYTIDNRGKSNG